MSSDYCPECGSILSKETHRPNCSQAGEMYWPNPRNKMTQHVGNNQQPDNVHPHPVQPGKLPTDAKQRKAVPITTGVLDYFPRALAAVAAVSLAGNQQHNPGKPLHWDKTKSTDHADCIGRHLLERGTIDTDGQRHSAKLAWRALANLEMELETVKSSE